MFRACRVCNGWLGLKAPAQILFLVFYVLFPGGEFSDNSDQRRRFGAKTDDLLRYIIQMRLSIDNPGQ